MENNTDVSLQETSKSPPEERHPSSGYIPSTKYPAYPVLIGPTGKTVSLDARPVVIPILSTVITFPLVALAVICALRYRAKRARKRDHQRRLQNRPCECSVTDAPPRIKVTEVSSPCVSREYGRSPSFIEEEINAGRRLSQYQTVSLNVGDEQNQRRISRTSVLFKLDKSGSEDLTDFPSEAADDFTYAYDILFRKAQLS